MSPTYVPGGITGSLWNHHWTVDLLGTTLYTTMPMIKFSFIHKDLHILKKFLRARKYLSHQMV